MLKSQNIPIYLEGPKVNINCTMDDVRGFFLGPPHDTTPAAVIANVIIKVSSFENNANTQRQNVGHIAQFRIMFPLQYANQL